MTRTRNRANSMAVVSATLERLGTATSKTIALNTALKRINVNQALAYLLEGHYVAKGDFTGRGNENYWIFLKPYIPPSDGKKDWDLHYNVFHDFVRASHEQI